MRTAWFFSSQRAAATAFNLYSKAADGAGEVERLTDDTGTMQFPLTVSPDGSNLILRDQRASETGWDLHVVSLEGPGTARPLLEATANQSNAVFSPDGRWIAYESNESGEYEIYVRPFRDLDAGLWQVSIRGGRWPVWKGAGREIFYVGPQGMTATTVETDRSFTIGASVVLFDTEPYTLGDPTTFNTRSFDLSSDSERFLMVKGLAPAGEGAPHIVVVDNWFEELKARVPVN